MSDPKQLAHLRVSALNVNSSLCALKVHSVDTAGVYAAPGGSTQVSIRGVVTPGSSAASMVDSTQNSLRVTVIEEPAGGSTLVTVRQSTAGDLQMTATPVAGSIWNVRSLQSSAADLQVTATPAVGSTWSVRPVQSSAADLQVTATPVAGSIWNVRALQSSAADLNVTVAGYSTVGTVSTVSGRVLVDQNSTVWPTQVSSVAGRVLVDQNSTVWSMQWTLPTLLSTSRSTVGNNSTRETLVSSVAGQRVFVYAYSITSTVQAVNDVGFFSSNANLLWPLVLQSLSSGISGANLAVSPPAFLFATATANPLTFGVTGTTGTYKLGLAYFQQP